MMQVNVRMLAPLKNRDAIVRAFRSRAIRVRAERGCRSCHLYRDAEDESALALVQVWSERADLDRHALSESFREILELVELSTAPPEISFQTVSSTAGLEYLAALHAGGTPHA